MTHPDAADTDSVAGADRTASWSHHSLLSLFVFLWGANFVLAELALREMAPISFSVARFLMGGGTLVGLFYPQYAVGLSDGSGLTRAPAALILAARGMWGFPPQREPDLPAWPSARAVLPWS